MKTPAFALTLVLAAAAGCSPTPRSKASASRHATLLFFSDAHADLETHPELFTRADGSTEIAPAGGYARMAYAAGAIRRETGGAALLIDGGDTFQGSGPAMWSRGEVVVGPQRALGVDLGVPGNWEVVHGADRMKELARETGYPWLAANVIDEKTGRPAFTTHVVKSVGGVSIGLVGYTDPDVPKRQAPSWSAGLKFLGPESIGPQVEAARAEGAELVVLVTHVGLARSLDLADRVKGIDVILSGDTHERVYEPLWRSGVMVVEPGAFASLLGRLDIELRPGEKPALRWSLLELRADRFGEDQAVRASVEAALSPYRERSARVLGEAGAPLERYGVLETSADDVLVSAVRAGTGADIALSNGFRFAHPIPAGPITEGDLWRLYPVTARVKVGKVTGAQLRAFWESEIEHVFARDPSRLFGGWLPRVSGMTVRFRSEAPAGHRLTELRVGGEPVRDDATYTIASCEREGDADDALCRMSGVRETRVTDHDVHDLVRSYLAEAGRVGERRARTVIAEDLPERVYSQFFRK